MRYFLPFVNGDRRRHLRNASIEFADMQLVGNKPGILLSSSAANQAIALFGAVVENRGGVEGEDDVAEMTLRYPGEPELCQIGVYRDRLSEYRWDDWRNLVQSELLPTLRRPVTLHSRVLETASPIEDGCFHVWFGASPKEVRTRLLPKSVFGHATPLEAEPATRVTGEDPTVRDLWGWDAAELLPDNLYCCHRPDDYLWDWTTSVAREVFRGALELELYTDDERQIIREARRAACRKESDALFRVMVEKIDAERMEQMCSEQKAKADELATLRQKQAQLLHELGTVERRMAVLRGKSLDERQADVFEEMRLIRAHEDIVDAWIWKDSIVAVTKGLIATCFERGDNPERNLRGTYYMGRFLILVSMVDLPCQKGDHSLSTGMRWFCLDGQVDGEFPDMHHPQIKPEGMACMGNYPPQLIELWEMGKWSHLFALGLKYARHIRIQGDRWGPHVYKWPKLSDEVGEEAQGGRLL